MSTNKSVGWKEPFCLLAMESRRTTWLPTCEIICLSFHYALAPLSGLSHLLCWTWHPERLICMPSLNWYLRTRITLESMLHKSSFLGVYIWDDRYPLCPYPRQISQISGGTISLWVYIWFQNPYLHSLPGSCYSVIRDGKWREIFQPYI